MLYKTWALFAMVSCLVGISDPIATAVHFKGGSFESYQVSSPECDEVFEGTNVYPVSHYLTGPTHLNSVVHFPGTTPAAFFSNLTLTGYFGYSNDFEVGRVFTRNNFEYRVKARGNVTMQFFLMSLQLEKRAVGSAELICTASGDFSAFR